MYYNLMVQGWLAMGEPMIDGRIVAVPEQRIDRDENTALKACDAPEGWADKPVNRRQKDIGVPLTMTHDAWLYEYKNHISVHWSHKLIWRDKVTDAAVQTSRVSPDLPDDDDIASDVWGHNAYRSAGIEEKLGRCRLDRHILRKGDRHRPLNKSEYQGNKTRLEIRVRFEHVFRAKTNDIGGTLLRNIRVASNNVRTWIDVLAYNMSRPAQVDRLATVFGPQVRRVATRELRMEGN